MVGDSEVEELASEGDEAFVLATKSVSQLRAITAAKEPSFLARTQPSAAVRSSRLAATA